VGTWLHADCVNERCVFTPSRLSSSPAPLISSSLYNCTDRRLLYAGQQRVYRPSSVRRHQPVITALLLLLGGVEQNPGPATVIASDGLRLGVLNARSAVHKAALIHHIIDSHRLDLLVLNEAWMSDHQPAAVTLDVAPPGYSVVHQFRSIGSGGGVAIVHRSYLRLSIVQLQCAVNSLELVSRRRRERALTCGSAH